MSLVHKTQLKLKIHELTFGDLAQRNRQKAMKYKAIKKQEKNDNIANVVYYEKTPLSGFTLTSTR